MAGQGFIALPAAEVLVVPVLVLGLRILVAVDHLQFGNCLARLFWASDNAPKNNKLRSVFRFENCVQVRPHGSVWWMVDWQGGLAVSE